MTKPLAGVTVLEVAAWTFVPAAGAILADLGADVHETPPPPMTADFVFCHGDRQWRRRRARSIWRPTWKVFSSTTKHGEHFEGMARYESHTAGADALRRMGNSGFLDGFLDATAYGTPEQIIAEYRSRWDLLGPFEMAPAFRFGGIPFHEAKDSMQLFAAEVLPELHRW